MCAPKTSRLDVGLRHLRRAARRGRAAPGAAVAHAAVEIGERQRAVLEPDLEVERPERAALVRQRGADERPAAVHRADGVLDRHAHVLEEHLVELAPAADLHQRPPGDARRVACRRSRQLMPLCRGAVWSVRTSSSSQSAKCALLDHTFCPLTTQWSPSRSARQRSDARSEPALGSEKPRHHTSSAGRMRGR